ncbi:MAG TPA: heme exporter protein CcmD [Burkholderiales bacterium]|nr:heme exporter protein CcmD [Burkholderiales bacterium]
MNWGSWDNFLAMGGYAFYVWGSYGVTLALVVAEVALLRARKRSIETTLVRTANARGQRGRA